MEFVTATNWLVSYDHGRGEGRARHRSGGGEGALFTVSGTGSVLFGSVDEVPQAVISAVSGWLARSGLSFAHLPLPEGVRVWRVPFEPRMINDVDPQVQGPSCRACAEYQADRWARAENCTMLTGMGGKPYRSPHAGRYAFEARFSAFACTQGVHGGLGD